MSYLNVYDIRNEDDISVVIFLNEGQLAAQQSINLEVPWKPDNLGKFSIRQFVITSVDSPQILSTVKSNFLTVTSEPIEESEEETESAHQLQAPVRDIPVVNDGPARYTVLVYMVASDLESQGYSATSDVMEMMEADISSETNVIVQTGGSAGSTIDEERFIDFTTVQRHQIVSHDVKTVMDLGKTNMGDSRTLQEFISWGVSEYPAQNYGIVLWDHGNGIRGFGLDDVFNDYLTIEEFRDSFAQAKKKTGVQFEFIGFDACLMATYEVATWMGPYADYLVSSEEIVPEWGWDYNTFLSSLEGSDQIDGYQVGRIIADSYMAHSKAKTSEHQGYDADRWITMSVIDLSKMREVRDLADDLGDALHLHINDLPKAQTLAKTLLHTERYGIDYGGSAGYSDLYELAENLGQSFPAYASMTDRLQAKIEDAVVYNISGEAKPNAHGISIFLQLDDYQSGSEHLKYLDSGWLGVIEGGAKRLAADDKAPTGWIDYSNGMIEGGSDVDDIAYGSISFYRESGGSRYEVVADYYLDPSRFLRSDGSIEYELEDGILSLCSGDDCTPAFVYLEDN